MRKILFIIFLGLVAFGFWALPWTPDIGSFPTQLEGERASIQRIAQEVRWHPGRKFVYKVSWKCAGGQAECGSMTQRQTIYDQNSYAIGYEVDIGSGWTQIRQCHSKEELYAVAKKGGTLQDFSLPGSP